MQLMKKILVPTDFSDCAGMALRYAVYLAKRTGAEIKLVHVCDLLDDHFSSLKKIIREYNKEKIAELTGALTHLKESVEKDDVVITTELYNSYSNFIAHNEFIFDSLLQVNSKGLSTN
jgi:nucleotide-binding universal stress UspA family protein